METGRTGIDRAASLRRVLVLPGDIAGSRLAACRFRLNGMQEMHKDGIPCMDRSVDVV